MTDDFDPYAQWLGIQPGEHPVDHYRLLGVDRYEPDREKIQTAADERMRHVRSFQTGPRGLYTQKLLNEIAAAKLRLLNPQSKRAYDESLRAAPLADEFDLGDNDPALLPPSIDAPIGSAGAAAAAPLPPAGPPSGADPAPTLPYVPQIRAAPAPASQQTARAAGVVVVTSMPPGKRPRRAAPGTGTYVAAFLVGALLIAALVWSIGRSLQQDVTGNPPQDAAIPRGPDPAAPTTGKIAVQQASGKIYLTPQNAEIHGSSPQIVSDNGQFVITDWTSDEDWLSWQFQVRRGGIFRVRLTYAVHDDATEGQVAIETDDQRKLLDLRDSGGAEAYITDEVLIGAKEPGIHTLRLRAASKPGDQLMMLRGIEIEPFRGRSSAEPPTPPADDASPRPTEIEDMPDFGDSPDGEETE